MKPFEYYEIEDAKEEELQALLQNLSTVSYSVNYKQQFFLQLRLIPIYVYIGFAMITIACIAIMLNSWDAKPFHFVELYMISFVVLILVTIIKSSMYECEELERSCKFSYAQILMTRGILLFSTMMVMLAIFALSVTLVKGASFLHSYLLLLSFVMSTLVLSEGCYLLIRGRDVRLLLAIYIVITLLMQQYVFPVLMQLSIVSEFFIFVMLFMSLCFVTKKLWKEMTLHGIESIELN